MEEGVYTRRNSIAYSHQLEQRHICLDDCCFASENNRWMVTYGSGNGEAKRRTSEANARGG